MLTDREYRLLKKIEQAGGKMDLSALKPDEISLARNLCERGALTEDAIRCEGSELTKPSIYGDIDESKLSVTERLGLAYCRLNSGEWDSLLGEPNGNAYRKMNAIQEIIGEANTSRAWWVFNLKKTPEEWERYYYCGERSTHDLPEKIQLVSYPPAGGYLILKEGEEIPDDGKCGEGEKRRCHKLKKLPALVRSFFFKK